MHTIFFLSCVREIVLVQSTWLRESNVALSASKLPLSGVGELINLQLRLCRESLEALGASRLVPLPPVCESLWLFSEPFVGKVLSQRLQANSYSLQVRLLGKSLVVIYAGKFILSGVREFVSFQFNWHRESLVELDAEKWIYPCTNYLVVPKVTPGFL